MLTLLAIWVLFKMMSYANDSDIGEPRGSWRGRDWYNPHALRGGHNRRGDFCFRNHRSSRY